MPSDPTRAGGADTTEDFEFRSADGTDPFTPMAVDSRRVSMLSCLTSEDDDEEEDAGNESEVMVGEVHSSPPTQPSSPTKPVQQVEENEVVQEEEETVEDDVSKSSKSVRFANVQESKCEEETPAIASRRESIERGKSIEKNSSYQKFCIPKIQMAGNNITEESKTEGCTISQQEPEEEEEVHENDEEETNQNEEEVQEEVEEEKAITREESFASSIENNIGSIGDALAAVSEVLQFRRMQEMCLLQSPPDSTPRESGDRGRESVSAGRDSLAEKLLLGNLKVGGIGYISDAEIEHARSSMEKEEEVQERQEKEVQEESVVEDEVVKNVVQEKTVIDFANIQAIDQLGYPTPLGTPAAEAAHAPALMPSCSSSSGQGQLPLPKAMKTPTKEQEKEQRRAKRLERLQKRAERKQAEALRNKSEEKILATPDRNSCVCPVAAASPATMFNNVSWEDYFMGVALLTAKRSKDPSTQVGACLVGQNQRILGVGYNGFPRGCDDDVLPWSKSAPRL